jgi:uncharacterized membrane protein
MITTIGRVLATGLIVALGFCVFANLAPISVWQMLLACVGWALAYFGDELAPLVGATSSPSTTQYVEPVIRGIGWVLLLAAFGLFVIRMQRLW